MANASKSAPGKYYRKGISLIQAVNKFGDEAQAEAWFVTRRWPDGIQCPRCDSDRIKPRKTQRRTPLYHCNACQFDFTVKTGTILHDSKRPSPSGPLGSTCTAPASKACPA